jgi:hypothetical protein
MSAGLGGVRDGLERRPPQDGQGEAGVSTPVIWAPHDTGRALDALRWSWAEAYDVGIDATGRWLALRRDGLGAAEGNGPDELRRAILEDFAFRPVRLP